MAVEAESAVILTPDEESAAPVLEEMWRNGLKKRDDVLGQDYFSRLRDFWNFRLGPTSAARTPTFRPQVMFSDLHWMAIQEAGDITDNTPLPVITGSRGERRSDHEDALRGQWYVGEYNLAFYHACLEALLAGTGFLMMVFDPYGRNGRGNTQLKWVDTENVVVDPGCTSFRNWQYVQYRSRLSLDEIRSAFPKNARRLPRWAAVSSVGVPKIGSSQADAPDQLRLPPGPMQQMAVGPIGSGTDTRILTYTFLKDSGRRVVEIIEGNSSTTLMPEIKSEPMYPYGRLIITCDKIKLFDGPNPYRKFPFIPVQVHPARNTFWAPPPIRYVIQLQEIAQTLMRQNIENTVRLNNGIVLINEAAGLNADSVLGLPGERVVVKSPDGVERAMKILTPPAFGGEMWAMPDKLTEKMRRDFGFNDTRAGAQQPGNQSAELFKTSLAAASGLTQVRARLSQPSVKLALEMVYETMLQYQNETMFPLPNEQNEIIEMMKWVTPNPNQIEDWELLVDPASVKAMSSTMARQYALLLRNAGLLPVEDTLVAIGWPNAKQIAEKVDQDLKLQLLAKEGARGAPRKR